MRAVAYVRVSSEEQVHGTSLDSQERECMEYAKKNGIELRPEDIFREEGVSAKIIDRPELARMIEFCARNKGKIHECIVWKVDRLARNSEYHHIIKAKLAKHGVKLVSVTEPISDDATGRLMESLLAAFAQFDNDIRTARTVSGMTARVRQGGWPHKAPIGYLKVRAPSGTITLRPDPDTAPMLVEVLELFATGSIPVSRLTDVAHQKGLRNNRGEPKSWESLKKILINPLYAGLVQSSLTDGEIIRGIHEPLISEKMHYRIVSLIRDSKTPTMKHAPEDWPLRGGFLRHTCNNPVTGSSPRGASGPSPRYHCVHCKASKEHSISTMRDIVHSQFMELLSSIRVTPEVGQLFKEIVLRRWNEEYKDRLDHNKRIQAELDACDEKRSRVIDLFVEGTLTASEKSAKMAEIDKSVATFKLQQIDDKEVIDNREEMIDKALLFMSDPDLFWNLGDIEVKRKIQSVIFPEGLEYDFDTGFGTPKLAESYLLIKKIPHQNDEDSTLVTSRRIELRLPG